LSASNVHGFSHLRQLFFPRAPLCKSASAQRQRANAYTRDREPGSDNLHEFECVGCTSKERRNGNFEGIRSSKSCHADANAGETTKNSRTETASRDRSRSCLRSLLLLCLSFI
jgi:hypothetical protein